MSIALLYNDKAPPDYQPPDFKAGDEGVSRIIEMSEVADNIKMKTGFHEYVSLVNCPQRCANKKQSYRWSWDSSSNHLEVVFSTLKPKPRSSEGGSTILSLDSLCEFSRSAGI